MVRVDCWQCKVEVTDEMKAFGSNHGDLGPRLQVQLNDFAWLGDNLAIGIALTPATYGLLSNAVY